MSSTYPPPKPPLLARLRDRLTPRAGDRRPFLEVQYHPGDIRKRVRYFFLTRRQVRRVATGVAAWVALVALGAAVTPSVVSDQLSRRRHLALTAERERLGERLQELVVGLGGVDSASEQVGNEMAKIYLAYGFDPDALAGQGGYPFPQEQVPESIFSETIARGLRHRAAIREDLAVLGVFLAEVQAFEEAHRDLVRGTPSISPLRGGDFVLTSPFARRRNPFTKGIQFHAGVDLAAPQGTPIHAAAAGVVTFADWYSLQKSAGWWRYGRLVAISHGERFITLYGHCDELLVEAGQEVEQGDVIATVGNTGWSTSPHLHYEVRRRGDDGELDPVDPRIYILDHRWRDEERLLVRARSAPDPEDYDPLPTQMAR